jgi:hypothetical protein
VAEEFGYDDEVGAAAYERRRERVSQDVGGRVVVESGGRGDGGDDVVRAADAETLAALVEKQRRTGFGAGPVVAFIQPAREGGAQLRVDRDVADALAFAEDPQDAFARGARDVVDVECDDLAVCTSSAMHPQTNARCFLLIIGAFSFHASCRVLAVCIRVVSGIGSPRSSAWSSSTSTLAANDNATTFSGCGGWGVPPLRLRVLVGTRTTTDAVTPSNTAASATARSRPGPWSCVRACSASPPRKVATSAVTAMSVEVRCLSSSSTPAC